MTEIDNILGQIESGDPSSSSQLLPLVYDELRRLAVAKLAQERPGQTIQATALVHDAYLRLVSGGDSISWNSRGHFFAAAAEAMRRILVDNARRKARVKHGGHMARHSLEALEVEFCDVGTTNDLLHLDTALDQLARHDARSAELVKLRFFAGLTNAQAAQVLDISPRMADSLWSFARAWLRREISPKDD